MLMLPPIPFSAEELNVNLVKMVTVNAPRMNRPSKEKSSLTVLYRVITSPGGGAP